MRNPIITLQLFITEAQLFGFWRTLYYWLTPRG